MIGMARNPDRQTTFRFKRFEVSNSRSAMKVGTDGVLLGAWCDVAADKSVIDAGTGTGLIALMVAQRSEATVIAVEIEEDAATEATGNVDSSSWRGRISVVNGDFLDFASSQRVRVDHIVSNPPYFTSATKASDAARRRARHDEGFGYGSLLDVAPRLLLPTGRLSMISPADREDDIIFKAELARMHLRRKTLVSTVVGRSPSRILWEFAPIAGSVHTDSLSIRDTNGGYTPQYVALVKDFYFNM